MEKYIIKNQIIEAVLYTKGLEDGFRICYWFDNDDLKTYLNFKTLKELKNWESKMIKKMESDKRIHLGEIAYIIETGNNVVEIKEGDYIVYTKEGKFKLNKEAFNYFFKEV